MSASTLRLDADLVRRLVERQFPAWSRLSVRPVLPGGHDNRTFRLGDELLVRLPSGPWYAQAVAKEHRWLPVLGSQLPRPIPEPVGRGKPGLGYPYPWSVYRWLAGRPANPASIQPTAFAADLAAFLVALRAVDPSGGPTPGEHNWFRGAPLAVYEDETDRAITVLAGSIDGRRARQVWRAAAASGWTAGPVWFHGDVAAGNLLVDRGRLAAVIDFGTCGVGDPACDLVVAWTLLDRSDETLFRASVGLDDATWDRGRGWALWKALITLAAPTAAAADRRAAATVLQRVLG